jgi:hypothetical protein
LSDALDWLNAPFAFPTLEGRNVLVLGLGGGSDIISAYAVSRLLPAPRPARLIYANTKTKDDGTLEMITPHIGRVAPGPSTRKGRAHGTTAIDRGVPRGDEGCPWIFLAPGREAAERLPDELRGLGFDFVIGVDTGGDSLDRDASSGDGGRDKRMLRVLRGTGLPLLHVVVAPGSDGESSYEGLLTTFEANRPRFQGSFHLAAALPVFQSLSGLLGPTRTPRIILAASEVRLKEMGGRVIVPRGRKPAVPRDWLLRAYVFADRPVGTPC